MTSKSRLAMSAATGFCFFFSSLINRVKSLQSVPANTANHWIQSRNIKRWYPWQAPYWLHFAPNKKKTSIIWKEASQIRRPPPQPWDCFRWAAPWVRITLAVPVHGNMSHTVKTTKKRTKVKTCMAWLWFSRCWRTASTLLSAAAFSFINRTSWRCASSFEKNSSNAASKLHTPHASTPNQARQRTGRRQLT